MSLKSSFRRSLLWAGVPLVLAYAAIQTYVNNADALNPAAKSSNIDSLVAKSGVNSYAAKKAKQFVKNNDYFWEKSRDILGDSAKGYPALTDKVNTILSKVKHADRVETPLLFEYHSLAPKMTVGQKVRIYLMLNALKEAAFCDTIGKFISEDVSDKYAEHGGLVKFDSSNALKLENRTNALPKIPENNNQYYIAMEDITSPFIAMYHLHANEFDDSKFAGPSPSDLRGPIHTTLELGEAHEFVITSLSKGRFNVDYFGSDSTLYTGMILVDLGCYKYNPSKIPSSK